MPSVVINVLIADEAVVRPELIEDPGGAGQVLNFEPTELAASFISEVVPRVGEQIVIGPPDSSEPKFVRVDAVVHYWMSGRVHCAYVLARPAESDGALVLSAPLRAVRGV